MWIKYGNGLDCSGWARPIVHSIEFPFCFISTIYQGSRVGARLIGGASELDQHVIFVPKHLQEYSDASTNSSEEIGGQTCHQCRKTDRDGMMWCLKCDRRGYCSSCISKWLVYFLNCYFSLVPLSFWGRCVLPCHHSECLC